MKNNKNRIILVALLVLIGLVSLYSLSQITKLSSDNSSLRSAIAKNMNLSEGVQRQALIAPYQGYSPQRLAYEASTNKLYMPELRIRVPYSPEARTLLYTVNTDKNGEDASGVTLMTSRFTPPQTETTLDCTAIMRLSIEDKPNSFNPADKPAGSYKLKDGRTVQAYYNTGDLEGNSQCRKLYQAQNVSPENFAKVFTGVESY